MAEYAKRACCDCFHYTACKAILEASGLGNYMSTVSHGDRCPDFVHKDDVTTVRHGRWLDVQETDMYVPDLKLTATKTAETCSVCKARIGFIGAKLYLFDSFCPSCGAKMDLEVPENETL